MARLSRKEAISEKDELWLDDEGNLIETSTLSSIPKVNPTNR